VARGLLDVRTGRGVPQAEESVTVRRNHGFTLLELVAVIVIIGVTAAFAVPSWRQIQADSRLKGVARSVSNAFSYARSQAALTENVHIVYFGMAGGTDACGNPLVDAAGNAVPMLVLDDGAPGSALQNCCIDPGENVYTEPAVAGVAWGTSFAGATPADDTGAGNFLTGSSFSDQFGAQTEWVAFRPDGVPVGFTGACVLGQTGTGRGGIYVTNQNRDYAVLLTPLGSSKIHAFDRPSGTWSN